MTAATSSFPSPSTSPTAGPAVGDVDGDGKLEVVAVTREGYLWVWDTPTAADGLVEWGSFRHDARNSGRYP